MAINHFFFISITILLLVSASSQTLNPQDQGCSRVGLDLQNCLFNTNAKTPLISIEPCCKTLNQALEAGCYCLRSLLGPSNYPALTTELAVTFSICYISLPSLTHCHVLEQRPAPPAAALPRLLPRPPGPIPPSDEPFVPLPPRVKEIPPINSSIVEMDSRYLSSDDADLTVLQNSRNLLIVAVLLCMMA